MRTEHINMHRVEKLWPKGKTDGSAEGSMAMSLSDSEVRLPVTGNTFLQVQLVFLKSQVFPVFQGETSARSSQRCAAAVLNR
jgi:hypothetical protein